MQKRELRAVRFALSNMAGRESAHGQAQAGCNSPTTGLRTAIASTVGRCQARHPYDGETAKLCCVPNRDYRRIVIDG